MGPSSVVGMTEGSGATRTLRERRAVVAVAVSALSDIGGVLWQGAGAELGELLSVLDTLVACGEAARVAVTAEAVARGEVAASQCGSTRQWVRGHARSLAAGGAAVVARAAEELARPEHVRVREAVLGARVSVPTGVCVVDEYRKIRPRLADGADEPVIDGMLAMGAAEGPAGVRRLRAALVARYGAAGELQREQDLAARHVELSAASAEGEGIFSYRFTVDTEGKAVVEAALGPLSRPAPGPDGQHDPRWPAQRRGQALVQVCRRAVAAGDRPGTSAKATLFLTMSLAELTARLGAARTVGPSRHGDLLAPETVRRLACDAEVIPAVLGSSAEILDVARPVRLFSPAQNRALWVRDAACTFPGCDIPAHWCDAHHIVHWADGGPTTLGNAALLCGRHHTIVHRDRLTATVTPTNVSWDLRPGSYHRRRDHDPPPPRTG